MDLYNIEGNNVKGVERDVISRENLNLYRQHHAQSSSFHSLTYRRDIDVDIKLSYLKKYDKFLSQNINLMTSKSLLDLRISNYLIFSFIPIC
jgi:hypothetical protein